MSLQQEPGTEPSAGQQALAGTSMEPTVNLPLNPDMSHNKSYQNSDTSVQPSPDWTAYGQHGDSPMTSANPVEAQSPASIPPPRPEQVHPLVPMPGLQQHNHPRRRYEDNGKIYQCGWNGCLRAFSVIDHLNLHITMASHGPKRVAEDFEEVRKVWEVRSTHRDGELHRQIKSADVSVVQEDADYSRQRQTQIEINTLREKLINPRRAIHRADAIVQELNAMRDLPGHINERLAEVSGMLLTAKIQLSQLANEPELTCKN